MGHGNFAWISGVGAKPTVEDCAETAPARRARERATDAMAWRWDKAEAFKKKWGGEEGKDKTRGGGVDSEVGEGDKTGGI